MTALSAKLTRGTVPLSNLPERTKIVDNSVMGLTIDGQGFGTFRPSTSGYCTKDADGKYWIHVEYAYTGTGNTAGHDLYFNTFSKADASEGGGAWAYVDALSAAAVSTRTNIGDRIQITYATNQDRGIGGFSFQVTKPTWFDANREAGFSINAQVEETTPTTAGLAPARSSIITFMSGNGDAQGTVLNFDSTYGTPVGTGFTSNGSGVMTCNFTGHIIVHVMLHMLNPGNGQLFLRKNGSNYLSGVNMLVNNVGSDGNQMYPFSLSVNAGDTIDFIYDGTGGTYEYGVASPADGGSTYASFVRIA